MESIYNKVDNLIYTIDSEFIKFSDCAEKTGKFEYYDFFSAIDQLIELVRRYSLVKNYNDKLVQYHHTMKDLFETEAKVIFIEIIEKNDNNSEITVKYSTYQLDTVGLIDEVKTISIDKMEYKSMYQNKNLKELNKNTTPIRMSRYRVLKNKCKSESDLISLIEQWGDTMKIERLFYKIHLDNLIPGYYSGYFEQYVKKLKKQVKNLNHKINRNKEVKLAGFKSHLSIEQAKELCRLLRGEYIAPETTESNFAAVFINQPLPDGFNTVEWIKKQKRNKSELNKKAVFDLLKIAGVDLTKTDLPTINSLICGTLNHGNWNGNKGIKTESEAYPELKEIISKL